MRIRRLTCPHCGAPRERPSETSYIYCDYCGQYMGLDFFHFLDSKEDRIPGPAYRELIARMQPKLDSALAQGRKDKYQNIQRKIFEAHMKECPGSYSPRIGDSKYKQAMLDFLSASQTLAAFDPELTALKQRMDAAIAGLKWVQKKDSSHEDLGPDTDRLAVLQQASANMQVKPNSFWRLYDAFEAHHDLFVEKVVQAGLMDRHPDEISVEQMKEAARSVFAEGWLPFLRKRDAKRLLEKLQLASDYVEVDPPKTLPKNCGVCGTMLQVVEGARTVVCSHCGHKLDMERPAVSCGNCGANMALPQGVREITCPYCSGYVTITL